MATIVRDSNEVDEPAESGRSTGGAASRSSGAEPFVLGGPAALVLAVLSGASGAIHLAMVPEHAGEWLAEGIAFAAAGWLQVGLAALLLTRPSRAVLRVTVVANAVFVAAWGWSRLAGWPVGPNAGVVHAVSFVDAVCVGLEVTTIVLAGLLLFRPALAARSGDRIRSAAAVGAAAVLVLATAAIASPSARGHAHPGGAHDAAAADGAAHAHDPAAGDHHDMAPAPTDDKGLSLIMNGQGEGGGHTHSTETVRLDAATQAQLDAQLATTKTFIDRYPTIAAAEADGYLRYGPFSPGLGAHYTKLGGMSGPPSEVMDDAALANPFLIFDGTEPDAKLAGFMYIKFFPGRETPPEGFAGPNDHWHFHTNVCLTRRPGGGVDAPLGSDASVSKELCDKYGGFLMADTGYMVHVWTVPGYESPQGLFSNANAKIDCPNGTYYTIPLDDVGNRKNVCRDVNE